MAADERFIPGTSRITEIESFHRYVAAATLCDDCRVLDAASGEGYGSALLAKKAKFVTGVDLDEGAVRNAAGKYPLPNVKYVQGNVENLPFPDASFDRVVSFETIEHIAEPRKFVAELRRLLTADGVLILSSPNKAAFRHRNHCENGENPYHIHEMEPDEVLALVHDYFPCVRLYHQDAFYNSLITGDAPGGYVVRDTAGEILEQPELIKPQYSILLASTQPLPKFAGSSFIDGFFDETFGYCADDEAVVNQFGLRGEFNRSQADLAQKQNELTQKQNELEQRGKELTQTREELAHANADLAHEKIQCAELHGSVDALQRELAETKRQLAEEHAKSEYLFYIYNELKQAWSLRIFGRFSLRKRVKTGLRKLGAAVHKTGKAIFLALPGSYRIKQGSKNFLYRKFGWMLKDVQGYKDWCLLQTTAQMLLEQGDTGLIVPKDMPLTSIIIPVYNHVDLTENCLAALYRIKSQSPFEVLIVDDCSTEKLDVLQREFPCVKIVRNEKNLGFLLTANHGAEVAAGEYVLFLNNDTEAMPGWLDELTTALYHHPEAGMIGSQLIHMSTQRLQESGNLICKNGDMIPLGRGESPDHPDYNFFREVDFCSGASIILRKKVFQEMYGFDKAYVPAYYDDPDLGLRLKKAGYKNFVMPLSRIQHQEMASYGTALDDRCAKNRQFFLNRWHNYLQKNSLYDSPQEYRTARKFPRPRILYIDAEVPMADRGSGGMDAIFFMEYFKKRGYDVVFHGEYTPGYVPKYTTILLRMGVECVYEPYRKIWEYLESFGHTFQTLFISRIYQARCFDRLLKKYAPQATYVFDTVDVHFVREFLEAELHHDETMLCKAKLTKKFELQVAGAADATIVISSDEKKLLENEYHLENVWHIPQAREIFGLAPNPNRHGAVFIGSAHPPNMDGLRYFHDEILPLLPADFHLTIIGEALKKVMAETPEYKDLLNCPQFTFAGFVQDLGTVLNNARMTVAPLRYGAGTKGKVASSMAYGIPCVSSKFGTEGTGMVNRENILIAATPAEFAAAIQELDSNPTLWKRISDGGIQFLRDNYSCESVEQKMDALMEHVEAHRDQSHWATTPVVPKEEEARGE